MPVQFTYPGVYIEELPSAVHTITGVATSIAAFAGWADQGPTNKAVLVQSWSDFNTQYGGLDSRSYLGYAVNQFFQNGGQQAYIVRIVDSTAATATATVTLGSGSLDVEAASPGLWGSSLQIAVAPSTASTNPNPSGTPAFNLQVLGANSQVLESYFNLSSSPSDPAYAYSVINAQSQYITFASAPAAITGPVVAATTPLAGGADGNVLMPWGSVPAAANGVLTTPDGAFESALCPTTTTTSGVWLLGQVPIFTLLCVPGLTDVTTIATLQSFCAGTTAGYSGIRAFYIVDCPATVSLADLATTYTGPVGMRASQTAEGLIQPSPTSANSAYYFPWVMAPDPLAKSSTPRLFPPCGFVAGNYAATDASRGVWKAPAGIDTGLSGALGLQYNLTDSQNGELNPLAVNCFRNFRVYGNVIWGARTMLGADAEGNQWKYIPIRRFALFLETSLYDGTQWVVFEPNDATLWGQIRLNVGSFMQSLFLQGAFQGTTPAQAYFVTCDATNNPQSSIDQGIVNILVGFAPLYPAEFVVIQIQQMAGQSAS